MGDYEHLLKQAVMQIAAGGFSGFTEICILQPLDLVKTRLQLQTKQPNRKPDDPYYYRGIWDCFTKMVKHEGVLALWKGILPPILAETPKKAVKFMTFEQYKRFFMFGSNEATPLTFACAGLCAGFSEGAAINAFEHVKVAIQSNKAYASKVPSTWSVARQIVREHGWGTRGLNKGLTCTITRNGIFNLFYLGFYHSAKGIVPEFQDPVKEFCRKVVLGMASGILASCANSPFDVAKSRIQGPQPTPGEVKYRYAFKTVATVYREEGYKALYKGLLPKIMRQGPGGAIVLLVYEWAYDLLQVKFDSKQ